MTFRFTTFGGKCGRPGRFTSDSQRKACFANINRFSNRFSEKIYHVSRKGNADNSEDLTHRDFGRDTGYFGTGIYGYKSRETIDPDEDVSVKEVIIENPFIIDDREKSLRLHDSIRDVHRSSFYPRSKKMHYDLRAGILSNELNDLGIDVSEDEIKREFRKDAKDISNYFKTGDRSFAAGKEQAITRILKKRGYDGLIPGEDLADHCGFGCVKYVDSEDDEIQE
jgi:hypothetical protein